jgi:hypothetical protein
MRVRNSELECGMENQSGDKSPHSKTRFVPEKLAA